MVLCQPAFNVNKQLYFCICNIPIELNHARGLPPQGWNIQPMQILKTYQLPLWTISCWRKNERGRNSYWLSPNTGGNNNSAFTAVPGGFRQNFGFSLLGYWGSWWSSTPGENNMFWSRFIVADDVVLARGSAEKTFDYSVRCIRD